MMDGSGGDNRSYKTCKAPVKCHHQQTNTHCFTGQMSFLSLNQQCQSTEGNIVVLLILLLPSWFKRNNCIRRGHSGQSLNCMEMTVLGQFAVHV